MRPPPPPREPWIVEHRHHESRRGRSIDVHLRVVLDGDGIDADDVRALALRELKRIVAELEAVDWERRTTLGGGKPMKPPAAVEGPFHAVSDKRPPRPRLRWRRPPLPDRELRTCHEVVEGILLLGANGKAVPVGELAQRRSIPEGRLYKVLGKDTPGWDYLQRYVQEYRSGGKRLLDLTPEGRVLASRIRAGDIEV